MLQGFNRSYGCGITLHYGVRHQGRGLQNCTVRTSSGCCILPLCLVLLSVKQISKHLCVRLMEKFSLISSI